MSLAVSYFSEGAKGKRDWLSAVSVGSEVGRCAGGPLVAPATPELLPCSVKWGESRVRHATFPALKRLPYFLSSGNFIVKLPMSL